MTTKRRMEKFDIMEDMTEEQVKKYLVERIYKHFLQTIRKNYSQFHPMRCGKFDKWDVESYVDLLISDKPIYWH